VTAVEVAVPRFTDTPVIFAETPVVVVAGADGDAEVCAAVATAAAAMPVKAAAETLTIAVAAGTRVVEGSEVDLLAEGLRGSTLDTDLEVLVTFALESGTGLGDLEVSTV
jgi:hypothetical protein